MRSRENGEQLVSLLKKAFHLGAAHQPSVDDQFEPEHSFVSFFDHRSDLGSKLGTRLRSHFADRRPFVAVRSDGLLKQGPLPARNGADVCGAGFPNGDIGGLPVIAKIKSAQKRRGFVLDERRPSRRAWWIRCDQDTELWPEPRRSCV